MSIDLLRSATPTKEQHSKLERVIDIGLDLLECIEMVVPEGRYHSICKTKLEELMMFVHKAICHD